MTAQGSRIQFRNGNTLEEGEDPLPGEPFWFDQESLLGFYDGVTQTIKWIKIGGGTPSMAPHRWEGTRLFFQSPDGQWDEGVELSGAGLTSFGAELNQDGSVKFVWNLADGGQGSVSTGVPTNGKVKDNLGDEFEPHNLRHVYTYTPANKLKTDTAHDDDNDIARVKTYTYDTNGNLIEASQWIRQ